jgi:glucokinase
MSGPISKGCRGNNVRVLGHRSPSLSYCCRRSRRHNQYAERKGKTRFQAAGDYIVAGDIGGTNARFQLWQMLDHSEKELVFRKKYATAGFGTFIEALLQFENDCKFEVGSGDYQKPKAAAFAAAGVVVENKFCKMTNLDWTLNSAEVREMAGWHHASILNDFEAVGYGVLAAEEEDLHVIHQGNIVPKAPKVVLGPGTGFGQAQLFWNQKIETYTVMPSEGAHGDFGPRGEEQRGLLEFVERGKGYCELEHVCCGPGLENIYNFLSSKGNNAAASSSSSLSAPEIASAALGGSDELACQSCHLLLSILGQEAGNWALRSLSRGGIYIAGGITPKLLPLSGAEASLKEGYLHKKSRFSHVIKSSSLVLVTNDDIGLAGSCLYAQRALH